jgi:hypothetical protein
VRVVGGRDNFPILILHTERDLCIGSSSTKFPCSRGANLIRCGGIRGGYGRSRESAIDYLPLPESLELGLYLTAPSEVMVELRKGSERVASAIRVSEGLRGRGGLASGLAGGLSGGNGGHSVMLWYVVSVVFVQPLGVRR